MTRQVAFACNIARPQARDTPRSGHPAPTSLPCQPRRFDLPVLRQANHLQGQHSAREQERAETARQGTLTVTFTARKSPVQATPPTRQPIHQPQHLPFFKVHSICAQRRALQPPRASEAVGWKRLLGDPIGSRAIAIIFFGVTFFPVLFYLSLNFQNMR